MSRYFTLSMQRRYCLRNIIFAGFVRNFFPSMPLVNDTLMYVTGAFLAKMVWLSNVLGMYSLMAAHNISVKASQADGAEGLQQIRLLQSTVCKY